MSKTKTTFWLIIAAALCVVLAGAVVRQLPPRLVTQSSADMGYDARHQRADATQGGLGGAAVIGLAGMCCLAIPFLPALVFALLAVTEGIRHPDGAAQDDM
ncbi:MAG TPA: hypothetical protein VM537_25970 [Anaerolineae bacterium]|nr:hypothetical protein [Anaerolineae bacterium]